jgi:hypothetical protein
MRTVWNTTVFFGLVILMSDCREPFDPQFETGIDDFLVVDGYVNVGEKAVSRITLSRISALGVNDQTFDANALVSIQSSTDETFSLRPEEPGRFVSDSLTLDPALEYRLLISTDDGKEYASEFVKALISPPIDSIHWRWQRDGVQLYVTTHDPLNNTFFYKWTYDETWEIRSAFWAEFEYRAQKMVLLHPFESSDLFYCFVHNPSSDLHFASTKKNDVDATHYPLINFGYYSFKLLYRYSVLVKQRAMTEAEFNYLSLIQKNTTVTGSLFDPMPGELHGNIYSLSSPGEPVIGYIGASSTEVLRFNIEDEQIEEIGFKPVALCQQREIPRDSFWYWFDRLKYHPIDSVWGEDKYTGAPSHCMDCSLRGTPVRPEFFSD